MPVNPAVTTIYELTEVRDANCDNTLMDEQTIVVHDPPTVTLDSEDCNGTGTAYSSVLQFLEEMLLVIR
ncbi:MAG: hypothetical protein R2825_02900 [Saprospiraceae bacterium]